MSLWFITHLTSLSSSSTFPFYYIQSSTKFKNFERIDETLASQTIRRADRRERRREEGRVEGREGW
jgi:hypothetical protein